MKLTKKSILTFIKCVNRYGILSGIDIYFKLNSSNTKKVHLEENTHPLKLRSNTSDIPTFHQIFTYLEYDIDLTFEPELIIDAGANIGLAAVFFANKYPNSKIISIEPERANYNLLKINTSNYRNIVPLNYALSSVTDQDLAIIDRGYGNWGFMTEDVIEGNNEKIIVKSISINEILKNHKSKTIDILKVDIEGYEKELFQKNYETWLPNVKCLIIELHDRMKDGCSKSFFSAISKYDFNFFHKGENLVFINNKLD